MKENFQIHIWLGLLLCLLGMSCSDDTPAKGNEPGNGNTELEVNEWIESVMRSDYLWNNDIPAQDKLDFSADPQTFFSSMLSLKDAKTRNGKHLYYYSLIWRRIKIIKHVPALMRMILMVWSLLYLML